MRNKMQCKESLLGFRFSDGILHVWLSHDPKQSFSVERRKNEITAFNFEGDFTIKDVSKAKQIFKEYEEL